MDGHILTTLRALGPAPTILAGSFACNGASDPDPTQNRYEIGGKFVVTHTVTGAYDIALPQGAGTPAQPHSVITGEQFNSPANWFSSGAVAETSLNTTTRKVSVFTHRNGTATDVAANAGSRVNFIIFFDNSTGAG